MPRILLALLLLALPALGSASPFLTADSYTTGVIPSAFRVSVDGAPEVSSPAFTGTMDDGTSLVNTLHYDVGSVTVGPHAVNVKSCKDNGVWGEACSAAVPFSFTRPALGAPPTVTGTQLRR